jgi:hypothetical protein
MRAHSCEYIHVGSCSDTESMIELLRSSHSSGYDRVCDGAISCSLHADTHLSFSDRIGSRVVHVRACVRACLVVSAFAHMCDAFRRTFSPLSSSFMLKSSTVVHLATSQTTNTLIKEPEPQMTQLYSSVRCVPSPNVLAA